MAPSFRGLRKLFAFKEYSCSLPVVSELILTKELIIYVCKRCRHYFHHPRRFLSLPMIEITGVCALVLLRI